MSCAPAGRGARARRPDRLLTHEDEGAGPEDAVAEAHPVQRRSGRQSVCQILRSLSCHSQ